MLRLGVRLLGRRPGGRNGRNASDASIAAALEADATVDALAPDEAERLQLEKEIEMKRNKSRLNPKEFNRLRGLPEFDEPKHWTHYTVKYQRKRYGTFGRLARIDPALCWMTPEEFDEKLEYERVAHPFTLQQMMAQAKEKKEAERRAIKEREEEIDQRLLKLDKWIKDMEERQQKKMDSVLKAKEKKNRLIEEVRRHFGFTINPRDERFKALLEEKEKAQKKAEKDAKKAAREAHILLKMQQKTI